MKRTTSQDVAKAAGVSRAVVSAVLNGTPGIRVSGEKRQAVLDAIESLGYRVNAQARGMRTGRSGCIGAYGSLDNPFFLQVLQGAQQACMKAGYQLLLYGKAGRIEEQEELLALYRERRIDGLITKDTTGFDDQDFAAKIKAAGLPFVSVEGYPQREDVASVLMDYGASIKLAMAYIWSCTGYAAKYVLAHHGDPGRLNWGDQARVEAYSQWMAEKGLEPQVIPIKLEDNDQAWNRLLEELPRPGALLCNWFAGSAMIYKAAAGLGIAVGRDVMVMSADNTAQANRYMVPSLSSIEVPYREMGEAAAARVIEASEGAMPSEGSLKLWLPARLSPGESVGAIGIL